MLSFTILSPSTTSGWKLLQFVDHHHRCTSLEASAGELQVPRGNGWFWAIWVDEWRDWICFWDGLVLILAEVKVSWSSGIYRFQKALSSLCLISPPYLPHDVPSTPSSPQPTWAASAFPTSPTSPSSPKSIQEIIKLFNLWLLSSAIMSKKFMSKKMLHNNNTGAST